MANRNCAACDELKQSAPNLIVNGLTDTECNSLANDTGLNPSNSNNDYTDLNNMNDCLIGNMADEIELYDVCDWKDYMKKFVGNAWTMFKGIICAIRGIWINIKNLWAFAKKLQCQVDYLFKGATFGFGEGSSGKKSYIVAGKGASFSNVDSSGTASDVEIIYISGGLCRLTGSLRLYDSAFTDNVSVYNYDNGGVNPTKSETRKGNSEWKQHDHNPKGGSQLAYEIRIYKPEFPQISRFFTGIGLNALGGGFHAWILRIGEGSYAPGQNGSCDTTTGKAISADSDDGHLVPKDWEYLQVRISWIENIGGNGAQFTPIGLFGVRIKQDGVDC